MPYPPHAAAAAARRALQVQPAVAVRQGAAGGSDLLAIASSFDKFRFECPCIDADHFGLDKIDNCNNAPAVERQTYTKKLAGDPNVVYDIKLHVRGDTEPNTYVKGKLDPNGCFYVGGETAVPGYSAQIGAAF